MSEIVSEKMQERQKKINEYYKKKTEEQARLKPDSSAGAKKSVEKNINSKRVLHKQEMQTDSMGIKNVAVHHYPAQRPDKEFEELITAKANLEKKKDHAKDMSEQLSLAEKRLDEQKDLEKERKKDKGYVEKVAGAAWLSKEKRDEKDISKEGFRGERANLDEVKVVSLNAIKEEKEAALNVQKVKYGVVSKEDLEDKVNKETVERKARFQEMMEAEKRAIEIEKELRKIKDREEAREETKKAPELSAAEKETDEEKKAKARAEAEKERDKKLKESLEEEKKAKKATITSCAKELDKPREYPKGSLDDFKKAAKEMSEAEKALLKAKQKQLKHADKNLSSLKKKDKVTTRVENRKIAMKKFLSGDALIDRRLDSVAEKKFNLDYKALKMKIDRGELDKESKDKETNRIKESYVESTAAYKEEKFKIERKYNKKGALSDDQKKEKENAIKELKKEHLKKELPPKIKEKLSKLEDKKIGKKPIIDFGIKKAWLKGRQARVSKQLKRLEKNKNKVEVKVADNREAIDSAKSKADAARKTRDGLISALTKDEAVEMLYKKQRSAELVKALEEKGEVKGSSDKAVLKTVRGAKGMMSALKKAGNAAGSAYTAAANGVDKMRGKGGEGRS
jgi:colicin import membrane protein